MTDILNQTPTPKTAPYADSDVALAVKPVLKKPQMYAVIMHNDNYTTMEFVVYVLTEIFDHPMDHAYTLMMQIHEKGQAAVALLPYQIAEMKVDQVDALAESAGYPLLTTIEPA